MNSKRPYKHILKNLFHEQATEIIPVLMPGYRVEQVLDIEMPELKTFETEEPPSELDKGLVGLALPGAEVLSVIETEWIEHSGNFERAYRAHSPQTDEPTYLLIEFQAEREDEDLPLRLLSHFARVNLYALEDVEQAEEHVKVDGDEQVNEAAEAEREHKGTTMNRGYSVYPAVLCQFPNAVPTPVEETFNGKVILSFNFKTIDLWKKDAREILNSHVSASYFLLPAMKNADAALLGLAIEELAQQFQRNDSELGRHLTGLNMMLQQSEMMSEGEKLVAQGHLKRFSHLIKSGPYDE